MAEIETETTTEPAGKLGELFALIESRRAADLTRGGNQYPRNNPIASDISPCTRETALAVLHWKKRQPFGLDLLARFEVGRDAEPKCYEKLFRYGLEIVEQQQPFELRHEATGALLMRGRIDGKIKWKGVSIPFDYKTVNPMAFGRLHTLEDLLHHPFFQKWPRQMWSYLYANNAETGFLLLDNLLGEWRFIEVPLDYLRIDEILRQCQTAVEAVDAVRAGTPEDAALPPFHTDPSVCRRCWAFGRVCNPPVEWHGLQVIDDIELEMKLDKRGELHEAHLEYDRVHEELKKRLAGLEQAVVGKWLIQGKETQTHRKPQEAKIVRGWKLDFTRVGE